MMNSQYTRTAISLHWLVAIGIFLAFPLGIYMHDLPLSPTKLRLFSYHKWLGITVLLIAIVRVLWRASHRPPMMPIHMPKWQQRVSEWVHIALYVLILAIPFSGWLMSSAKGFQTVWFGVLPLPDLLAKNIPLGDLLKEVHELLNYLLLALLLTHIGAALKHHFIDRDGILLRMLPHFNKG
jgi:cytochrome b561